MASEAFDEEVEEQPASCAPGRPGSPQGLKSFTTSILARLSLFEMKGEGLLHHLDEVHALADRVLRRVK